MSEAVCLASLPGCTVGGRVIFIENHDTVPQDRQGRIPAAILRGNRENWPECSQVENNYFSLKRTALALGILMTSPGIPMLLQGQELFETCSPTWPFGPLIDYSRMDRMEPKLGYFKLLSDLCSLRVNENGVSKGLTGNHARVYHINDFNDYRVIIYHRWFHGGPSDDCIVVVNCSNIYFEEYWCGFPRLGNWVLRFNSDSSNYCNSFDNCPVHEHISSDKNPKDFYPFSGCLSIPPYSVLIYSQNALSSVQFVLRDCKISNSDCLICVGSIPELGSWNVNDGLLMNSFSSERDFWKSVPINISQDAFIEFKFVILENYYSSEETNISWQAGENNVFATTDNGSNCYQIDCKNIEFQ